MGSSIQMFGIDRLPLAERLLLLDELSDSVARELEQTPLTDAQRSEVDRRLAAHDADPKAAIPAAQVHAEVRARMKR